MAKPIGRYKSWSLFTLVLLLLMGSYFAFNPSYQLSVESKFYYSMSDYEKAYDLSSEAYEMEPYNRMARSVMVQSQYALRYVHYNEESQKYLEKIASYANQEKISRPEQIRIKMMCDIMIDKHNKMQPTILIDKDLVKEARENYKRFKKLNENLAEVL
ncbi:hypothetical protein JHD50_11680 [Sulfurimonas sp. MAG313]|nr:hypothetical protein [Sulfurimonas sp. MAG313]MDF1881948.1 hypothetical protein [Sulfurimonas sp. MAG313]